MSILFARARCLNTRGRVCVSPHACARIHRKVAFNSRLLRIIIFVVGVGIFAAASRACALAGQIRCDARRASNVFGSYNMYTFVRSVAFACACSQTPPLTHTPRVNEIINMSVEKPTFIQKHRRTGACLETRRERLHLICA